MNENKEILKNIKYYGAVLFLLFLIVFDIGIYSRILGIRGPSIITVATGFLDTLDEWRHSRESGKTGAVTAKPSGTSAESIRHEHAAAEKPEKTETVSASDADQKEVSTVSDAGSGINSESSLADIMGIPVYSVLNGPEGTFLKDIAGYDDNDYSYTMVTACVPPEGAPADTPAPVSLKMPTDEPGQTYEVQVYSSLEKKTVFVGRNIPSGGTADIYNLTPGDICGYQILREEYLAQDGTVIYPRLIVSECFQVAPYEMRGIRTETLHNVRDLGGWSTLDGRHVRYGLLYRGSAFDSGQEKIISDADISLLVDRLGIRNDLDLRWDEEIMLEGASTLGDNIRYARVPMQLYITFVEDEGTGDQLNQIFDMLLADEPLYFHCAIGCDRTGTLSFLLLGLLGVSESDINKEYELSSFSVYGLRERDSEETFYKDMIFYIKENFEGNTLSEKIRNYLLQRGVSSDKIDAFKEKMLV